MHDVSFSRQVIVQKPFQQNQYFPDISADIAATQYQDDSDQAREDNLFADALWQHGAPDDAAGLYLRTLKRLYSSSSPNPTLALVAIGMSLVCYEWNMVEEAQQCIHYGLAIAQTCSDFPMLVSGWVIQAVLCWITQREEAAKTALDQAMKYATRSGMEELVSYADMHRAWFEIRNGDFESAARWAQNYHICTNVEISPSDEEKYFVLSYLLIAQHRGQETVRLGMRLYDMAARFEKRRSMIISLLIQVSGYAALGEERLANQLLSKALELATPVSYLRCFLDFGTPIMNRISALSKRECSNLSAPQYTFITRLLDAWQASQNCKQPNSISECTPAVDKAAFSNERTMLAPLTLREREILRWISEGLTTKAIASLLTLTPGTVKWHIENIYSKLAVRTRTQAVAQARRLGLLS